MLPIYREGSKMEAGETSDFEFRNPRLLRLSIFGLAIGAYLFDRADIIWVTLPWRTAPDRIVAHLIFGFASVLVGLAAGLRTWAQAHTGPRINFEYVRRGGVWVADGPFRYVRHPIALGECLFVLGMGSLLSRSGVGIALIAIGILTVRLVAAGERQYQFNNPAEYADLCQAVPRLWPSLWPSARPAGNTARWPQAFRAEAADWGYFVMMVLFSITLNDRLAWTLAGAALLVSLVLDPPFRLATSIRASGTRQSLSCAILFLLLSYPSVHSQSRAADPALGSALFQSRCSACHSMGTDSKIDPGLAGVLRRKQLSERDIRNIVNQGRRTMPPVGAKIRATDLEDLMAYLKTL